jgi:hypothetical protein
VSSSGTDVRYRASSRASMAAALLALLEFARRSDSDFEFGPLDLNEAMKVGLVVRGLDPGRAALVLRNVPGLERVSR